MKCYFIIQGEGRGHWRQAMTLKDWLSDIDTEVSGISFGESSSNPFPPSFFEECEIPIHFYEAPTFIKDTLGQEIRLGKTIWYNLIRMPKYLKSVIKLHRHIKAVNPDIIFNFYDPIGGICSWFLPKSTKQIALANQFTLTHPQFSKPKGYLFQKLFLRIFNQICAGKAERWAMSWIDLPSVKGMKIFPPLTRENEGMREREEQPSTINYQPSIILVYMVNYGYGQQVEAWCKENLEQEVLCFWNHPTHKTVYQPLPNLRFEPLDKNSFAIAFEQCQFLVTSAGFQTVTEALLAQKAFRVIPVKGQYEQVANAHFLAQNQLASKEDAFNLSDIPSLKMSEEQLTFLKSAKVKYLSFI